MRNNAISASYILITGIFWDTGIPAWQNGNKIVENPSSKQVYI